jgi:hypothetical protein
MRGVVEVCKHGFTMPFTAPCKGTLLHIFGCDTVGLQKRAISLAHLYILSHN